MISLDALLRSLGGRGPQEKNPERQTFQLLTLIPYQAHQAWCDGAVLWFSNVTGSFALWNSGIYSFLSLLLGFPSGQR